MPLSSGVKAIDATMGGGLPTGAPSLIFGMPNLGKTWMCFQFACMCIRDPKNDGLGKPVLYLDTESFFRPDVFDLFFSYFEKRWPDLKGKKEMIEMIRVPDIFELGRLLGMQITLKQSESQVTVSTKFPTDRQKKIAEGKESDVKETVQSSDWLKSSEVWQRFKKKSYGLMVIDSLTVPIKSVISSVTQNLPARTSLITQILGTLYSLAIQFDAAIVVTDHITKNPIKPWELGDPWGGQNVTYYLKNQYGLHPIVLKDLKDPAALDARRLRRIERHRMPGKEKELVTVILQKDLGYDDYGTSGPKPAEETPEEAT